MTTAARRRFVPPPYPYDRLDALRAVADALPGGVVDCSIGTPCDPVPDVVRDAAAGALAASMGYPPSAGSPALRHAAAAWIGRRFDVALDDAQVGVCVGTKEFVTSLPHLLKLRRPDRDTVLYPAVAYPSYEMGAILAGCRAVAVPLDAQWHLDFAAIDEDDAQRALCVWVNEPGNPTSSVAANEWFGALAEWARARGVTVASDECYTEYATEPTTILSGGTDQMLALHSLSKRSNAAGLRVGFYAGDGDLVEYLVETRKHVGLMVPTAMQAAAVAALGDDAHVAQQRARYEERRAVMIDGLAAHGLVHDGGPMSFYLWLRGADGGAAPDGWDIARRLAADAGLLVSPGDLYGAAGAAYARVALVQPAERLQLALERLDAASH
ncbi:MAG: succinyldiaminopimelate aminotransferase apoenzyme [Actinomycetia bacterium]|nr:succinyldiaminopimelate aminotransferase apoenzyme [Actinomycetes bacterium]